MASPNCTALPGVAAPSLRWAWSTNALTSSVVMPGARARAAALCTARVMSLARCISATSAADFTWRQAAVIGPALAKAKLLPALRRPSTVKNGVAGSMASVPLS